MAIKLFKNGQLIKTLGVMEMDKAIALVDSGMADSIITSDPRPVKEETPESPEEKEIEEVEEIEEDKKSFSFPKGKKGK
jgi:TusA-related sulfurtransferase